jgi:hypothetical protein
VANRQFRALRASRTRSLPPSGAAGNPSANTGWNLAKEHRSTYRSKNAKSSQACEENIMADESKPQSWWQWWQTLPGIIASITGLITAIASVLAAIWGPTIFPRLSPTMSTTPTSVSAPTATNQSITNFEVKDFVSRYIAALNHGSHDLPTLLNLYDSRVDYFKKGVVSKDYIRQDKQDFYQKYWPVVENTLSGDIKVSDGQEAGEKVAIFMVEFFDKNPNGAPKHTCVHGTAMDTLTINLNPARSPGAGVT